jgi:hypothetical protein
MVMPLSRTALAEIEKSVVVEIELLLVEAESAFVPLQLSYWNSAFAPTEISAEAAVTPPSATMARL